MRGIHNPASFWGYTGETMSEAKTKGKKGLAGKTSVATDPAQADTALEDAMQTEAGHIDQIRDIIFGRQMSDYEKRFNALEKKISTQIKDMRDYTDERLKTMTDHFKVLHDTLSEHLQDERNQRDQAINAMSTALDAMSDQQKQEIQQLNDRLVEISGQFSDELHILQVDASKNLESAIQELDEAKLARGTLSQMLKEMATRLGETNH